MSDKTVSVSSDERRKVAQKLRAAAVYLPDDIDSEDLELALATTVCNYDVPNVETLFNRLADLIEPEQKQDCPARLEYDEVHSCNVCTRCGERCGHGMYMAATDDGYIYYRPMRFCPKCGVRFEEDE